MTVSGIPEEWARLRQAGGSGGDGSLGLASVELDTRAPAGRLRLAVGGAGELLLLAPVSAPTPTGSLPGADGLLVSEVVLRIDGRPQRFLQLACSERPLEGVFGDVVSQVAGRISAGAAPLEAMETTIRDYRTLLRRVQDPSLSEERLIGLMGELRILVRLLELNPDAWQAWAPVAGRHDFRAGLIGLECKTTLRSAGRRVGISSLEQLEVPEGGALHLCLQIVERDMAGPLSVTELGRQALSLAAGSSALEELLHECGWRPGAAEGEPRFALLAEQAYRIEDGFPRLTTASLRDGRLPAGLSSVAYAVDLSAASAFLIAEDDARRFEEQLVNAPAPLR